MTRAISLLPADGELPSGYANRLATLHALSSEAAHKKINGQFFTPIEVARFMAELIKPSKPTIAILDPGCGTALLACSLIEHLTGVNSEVKRIDLTVYETDPTILPHTRQVCNYLHNWLSTKQITFEVNIIDQDFVLQNKSCFQNNGGLFCEPVGRYFDYIIGNPPYFKIPKDDERAVVAQSIVWGQPNIYSIFMMTAARLLESGGQIAFIVPRSFAAGSYFRVFRAAFFQEVVIEHIHLFESRTDTFSKDNVLQETLVIKGRKALSSVQSDIVLSHSHGTADLEHAIKKTYPAHELIDLTTKEKILHLPVNKTEEDIIELFRSWDNSLHKSNMQISTGPVVSFRAAVYLFENQPESGEPVVPLFQLVNTGKMSFTHPVSKKNKPQYLADCRETRSLLLPNKNYVLLRRFSAKDDKSRLVACPYFEHYIHTDTVAIENHLNYIYRPKGVLSATEVMGLSAVLNSQLFDKYFRTFNGNINVSATELREMPLPPLDDICLIGETVMAAGDMSQEFIDEVIIEHFGLAHIFVYE